MAVKFTIGRKIGFGFGIVIFLTIVAFLFTNVTLNESKRKTDQVVNVVTPSVTALEELNLMLKRSQNLINKWYYVQTTNDDPFKKELRTLINSEYPRLKQFISDSLAVHWRPDEKDQIKAVFSLTDKLFNYYEDEVMSAIKGFSDYDDAQLMFTVRLPFEEIDVKLDVIYNQLSELISSQKNSAQETTVEMMSSFNFLQQLIKWLGIALVIGGILVAVFTVRSIVHPIQLLKRMLQAMSKGILPRERIPARSDEIGEMNDALTGLIGAMDSTTEFARQVGSGNFESSYEPLSEHDTLGNALLKMRIDLRENERVLEQKVIERTEEEVRQKEEIVSKNEQLEVLYKHVTDSIRYAKRIQEAILPPDNLFKQLLPQSFVLFKPKDIVSGDFYWIDKKDGKSMVAAVDCTGHGVPGAFMSIVGYNLLKDIVGNSDLIRPADIMDKMSEGVNKTLHNNVGEDQTKDGMDMSMCTIDYEKLELEYAGAFNPMYLIRDGQLMQFKADKFPVGLHIGSGRQNFTNNIVQLKKNDTIYIFSDGYADQFGGPKGKKFMAGHFRDLLISVCQKPITEQKKVLNDTIENWRGDHEQVDDILVIGIRI
jgi:serine phosphatase RsbU (regulator of sigma subunit)/CHASE3 domain sensor protein